VSAALFRPGRAALNWACSQQEPVKHMCERKKKRGTRAHMAVESEAAAAGVLCAECALVSCCASGRLLSKCMWCSSKQQEGEGVVHSI